jgi:mono/diheme cytochrome c family protein
MIGPQAVAGVQRALNRYAIAFGVVVLIIGIVIVFLEGGSSRAAGDPKAGETKFNANCAGCHGERGTGTKQGPPLVHKIYEPNHHGDAAFQRAAAQGVRAHHWNFGDMPKITSVTPADVDDIVKYIRTLQHQAGIF